MTPSRKHSFGSLQDCFALNRNAAQGCAYRDGGVACRGGARSHRHSGCGPLRRKQPGLSGLDPAPGVPA